MIDKSGRVFIYQRVYKLESIWQSVARMIPYKIFAGSSHPILANAICQGLEKELSPITIKQFACGETYVKFDETFRGQDVFLVQTCRTGHMNDDLMELFLMIDAARQSFARNIHVILPYFAYSRQDKIHEAREGISAKLLADLIVKAGANHVITLHLHSDQTQGFFDVPVDNLNPRRIFVDYFKAKNLKDAVIVSPDAGGAKMAKKFADELGVSMCILHKQRPEHNVSEVSHVIGDVAGKTPIIVDDMVDTAGSVVAAKVALLAAGANDEVYLCATHAIFSGPARERLSDASFAEIVCTDSLPVENPPTNFKAITMAPLFAGVVQNVAEQKSVSKLYL
ncbi:ribose-phosphate diphosphokinase [Candidatus Peregrinibacteria bacterium]|nr:ribose-phosphate diphosphokinase [Candidatus Peregrinibacteria bacterium]